MFRLAAVLTLAAPLALTAPVPVFADAYSDLMKVQAAFMNAKSWHAEEHFPNGKTTIVEYSAPDRWRIQPTPDVTELVIGDDVYMVRKGQATKLPLGGGMIKKLSEEVGFSVKDEIKQSVRDLGMQTLDGRPVHVYSYAAHGVPAIYVGSDLLPVRTVVNDKSGTITITYSKYNTPISIEPQ